MTPRHPTVSPSPSLRQRPGAFLARALAAVMLAGMLGTTACWGGRGAESPAQAQHRLAEAVAARDPQKLWKALDLDTRWSWMSIQRAHREAHDITLSNVPEGPERERLLRRFESAANAQDAAEVFERTLTAEAWTQLAARLAAAAGQTPVLKPDGTLADVATPAGPLLYRKASKPGWGWGYGGMGAEAEEAKRRASADLEMMRASAVEYERAAARGAR